MIFSVHRPQYFNYQNESLYLEVCFNGFQANMPANGAYLNAFFFCKRNKEIFLQSSLKLIQLKKMDEIGYKAIYSKQRFGQVFL